MPIGLTKPCARCVHSLLSSVVFISRIEILKIKKNNSNWKENMNEVAIEPLQNRMNKIDFSAIFVGNQRWILFIFFLVQLSVQVSVFFFLFAHIKSSVLIWFCGFIYLPCMKSRALIRSSTWFASVLFIYETRIFFYQSFHIHFDDSIGSEHNLYVIWICVYASMFRACDLSRATLTYWICKLHFFNMIFIPFWLNFC